MAPLRKIAISMALFMGASVIHAFNSTTCPQPLLSPSFEELAPVNMKPWVNIKNGLYNGASDVRAVTTPGTDSPPAGAHSGQKSLLVRGTSTLPPDGSNIVVWQTASPLCAGATYQPRLWLTTVADANITVTARIYNAAAPAGLPISVSVRSVSGPALAWQELVFDTFVAPSPINRFYLDIESSVTLFTLWLDDVTYALVI